MTESTVRPQSITIRKALPGWLYIYLRSNAQRRVETDMDGEEYVLYEYDETHLRLPLPDVDVDILSSHSANQDALKRQLKRLVLDDDALRQQLDMPRAQAVDWLDRISEYGGTPDVDVAQQHNWATAECIIVAPQDVSGLQTEIVGDYKQLIDIGDYRLWVANAPVQTLRGLHNELWATAPVETLGVLAVVGIHGESFLAWAICNATDKTRTEAANQRDTIADYFDALGYDGDPVRAAMNEAELIRGIVEGLEYTMSQLWGAMTE